MARTAYPTSANLKQFLIPVCAALHIDLPADVDYASRVLAARRYIEDRVGRPFLAAAQVRLYDPPTNPRGVIDFGADLLTLNGITVNSEALVNGTDYVLHPYNADLDGKPFRWVEFVQRFWPFPLVNAPRKSVAIDADWGFGTEIPEDCWDAMLAQGAIDCYPELALTISRGLQMMREGDVEEMYARGKGNGPLIEEMGGWQLRVDQAIADNRVVEVGL